MLIGSDAASGLNPTGCGLHRETKNRNVNAQVNLSSRSVFGSVTAIMLNDANVRLKALVWVSFVKKTLQEGFSRGSVYPTNIITPTNLMKMCSF